MRTVARYRAEAPVENRAGAHHYQELAGRLDTWLSWKGELQLSTDGELTGIRYTDGRLADAALRDVIVEGVGSSRTVVLTEPTPGGALFETTVAIALKGGVIHLFASLRVGSADHQQLAPVAYDARCPRVFRNCIGYDLDWRYGGDTIRRTQERRRGRAAGEGLATFVTSPSRMLPLVVVSELQGFLLHPEVAKDLAQELLGLAHIVQIDEEASWGLTSALGKQWSCYNGAIRLYWPSVDLSREPFVHPLWTARKLLDFNCDTKISAERLCSHLRSRISTLSAFTIREPSVLAELSAIEREQRFAADRARLEEASEYQALAESYSEELKEVKAGLVTVLAENEALRAQVESLTVAIHWKGEDEHVTPEPEEETPPTTVREAVEQARNESRGVLLFGDEVERGVAGLSPQAGPPEKVLQYLRALAELGKARQAGAMGTSTLEWLKRENIRGSLESETTVNSSAARGRRTFHDGNRRRFFEWHLKPAEAVAPDRCVRIYFDWCEARSLLVVGWVGRHPD